MYHIGVRRDRRLRDGTVRLSDGLALPREHRFVAGERLGGEHAAVCGDPVPLGEFHDVADDELLGVDPDDPAPAHDFCFGCGELSEFFDGGVRTVLLKKADGGVHEDDKEQNGGIDEFRPVPRRDGEPRRERRRKDEDARHQIAELRQKEQQFAALFPFRKDIAPVVLQPTLRLRRGKPLLRAPRRRKRLLGSQSVCFHTAMV